MPKEFREVVTIGEAEKRARSSFKVHLKQEPVPIEKALGRVLAVDVVAPLDVPPFDRASMDGYALKARDTYGASEGEPRELLLKGSVAAGTISKLTITKGSCVAIATGAPMPKGADAVLMVEYAENTKGRVLAYRPVAAGENVMRAGADIRRDEKILEKGRLITPRDTGVLAALGITKIMVYARPRIAVISTGAEIAEPGALLKPGMIYDVNSRTLADAVRENGGDAEFLGIARNADEIANLIKKSGHDLILTSGGTSVGEEDLTYRAVEKLGKLLVHGIAIKPGKPTMVGVVGEKLVIGLPGYPTSALMVFYLLVAPLLRKMAGLPPLKYATQKAELASRVYSAKGRLEYLPVQLKDGVAHPIGKGSGAITTLAGASGFVEIPEKVEILEEGSEVEVLLFQ